MPKTNKEKWLEKIMINLIVYPIVFPLSITLEIFWIIQDTIEWIKEKVQE